MHADHPLLADLENSVVGAARTVLHTLKPGLAEAAYQRALALELHKRGFRVEQQKLFEVRYDDQLVDLLMVELIVDGQTVVHCHVAEEFTPTIVARLCGALAITGFSEGLLLNFRRKDLDWKHVDRETVAAIAPH